MIILYESSNCKYSKIRKIPWIFLWLWMNFRCIIWIVENLLTDILYKHNDSKLYEWRQRALKSFNFIGYVQSAFPCTRMKHCWHYKIMIFWPSVAYSLPEVQPEIPIKYLRLTNVLDIPWSETNRIVNYFLMIAIVSGWALLSV